ncbi:hypothetical protein IV37_GL000646 [Fructilactobacillus fructivorans]|uniref:hypothetical protein n=1 Tax=Fructilactobacillus fructivorans TaxID=1614 RepID=UPI0007056814|nr:hypothetical protein [Fructilactobacillus fructivorans]KRN13011.1 hypothetical protein IV37_GL000646 [Fructilactobacillus fructivorans]
MEIEQQLFKNLKPNFTKLRNFGFKSVNDHLEYTTIIPQTNFSVSITVDRNGQVAGKVMDNDYHAEYTNFRAVDPQGGFATNIKKAYVAILKNIATHCFNYDPVTTGQEWIVPANPKFFDLERDFAKHATIIWKQTTHIRVGDTVYIYVTSPVSAIKYKCVAVAVNLPHYYHDQNITMHYVMRLHLLKRYKPTEFNLEQLKRAGVRAVRGPRHVPKPLSKMLNLEKE